MYRIIAFLLLIAGFALVANAALPILRYELITKSSFTKKDRLLSPLGSNYAVLGSATSDYTQASNWFDNASNLDSELDIPAIRYYTLSIPKLKIYRATVEIAGEDLSKKLIQYKGTPPPGKTGNTVVLGHSVLPQFYNPKNYLTIFSKLPTLKPGDDIIIEYDGITYKYEVTELFEVSPSAVEVLRQYNSGRNLTLITCVPPGTYLRRLIVRANLVPIE